MSESRAETGIVVYTKIQDAPRRRKLAAAPLFVIFLAVLALALSALLNRRDAFTALPGAWQPIEPRRALGAAVLEGIVYATGGWSGESTQLDTVEALHPDSLRWQLQHGLQVARSQHTAIEFSGRLYVIGGWSAQEGLVSEVELLAADRQNWEVVTHLPTPRREPGAASLEDRIVIAGGFNGRDDGDLDGYLTVVEAYEPATGRWSRLPDIQIPRRGLALVSAGGFLYALGGYNLQDGYLASAERYDPLQERWERLNWELIPRTWAAGVALDGEIALVGGYNLDGYLALVERIDPLSGQVCQAEPLKTPRAWLGAVPYRGGVLTLGGEQAEGIRGAVEWIEVECSLETRRN